MIPHVIASQQFGREWLEGHLFPRAKEMSDMLVLKDRQAAWKELRARNKGKRQIALFYQPSTRTRFSFAMAMEKIGGQVSTFTENAQEFSSAAKGETLEDSIKVISSYCLPHENHVIIIRHFEEGSALRAAGVSSVPIINAGDGPGQHPTQALLDIFTIWKEFGRIDGLNIAMVGDLKNGRTIRSLCYLLAKFKNIKVYFVSCDDLQAKIDIKKYLRRHGVVYEETDDLREVASQVDLIYQTRDQLEYEDKDSALKDYAAARQEKLSITESAVQIMQSHCIIMHPLPRPKNRELPEFVDAHRSARYFAQAQNGLFARMAILDMIFNEPHLIPPVPQA